MSADMQRKRSSEGPDGTLAPSDGQNVERAESPTPGLAQGMEPGTGRVLGQPQPAHSQSSLLGSLDSQPLFCSHSFMHVFTPSLALCHELGILERSGPSPPPAFLSTSCCAIRPVLSDCPCGLGSSSLGLQVPPWLPLPPSALTLSVILREACSDHTVHILVLSGFYLHV